MKVGWCCTANEASICFEAPKRFSLDKDGTQEGRGFLSCPSIRSYFASTFVITSPFALHLSCIETNDGPVIQPVFPFTSLTPAKVQEFVKVEPKSSWRSPSVAVVQMPSPYLFFADEPTLIRQEPVQLQTPTSHSWRLIPGKFNIYDWQRPLNWSIEWHLKAGDLIVRVGEPIYFVSFEDLEGRASASVDLVECNMTPDLEKMLQQSRGVTSIRRGMKPLFVLASEKRAGKNLILDRD